MDPSYAGCLAAHVDQVHSTQRVRWLASAWAEHDYGETVLRTNVAVAVARASSARLIPRRAASPVFWKLAAGHEASLLMRSVDAEVPIANRTMKMIVPLAHRQYWSLLFGGFSRSADVSLLREFTARARKARAVLDVGANAGVYTYHAVCVAPSARVVAVEPIAELAEFLRDNLKRNGFEHAEVINAVASAHPGQVPFFVGESDEASSLDLDHVSAYGGAKGPPRMVTATTIDEIADARNLDIDLIKIDVEGHEVEVLHGAADTICRNRPDLLIEVKARNLNEVQGILAKTGYRLRRFATHGLVEIEEPRSGELLNLLCVAR